MIVLVWIGVGMTVAGLLGLGWCIWKAMGLRKRSPDDDAVRAELRKLVPANLASTSIAFLGLALAVAGLVLS